MDITARFIGSGDAFGSGGRLQTCILIDGPEIRFMMDWSLWPIPVVEYSWLGALLIGWWDRA
jgi:hypothetical protein